MYGMLKASYGSYLLFAIIFWQLSITKVSAQHAVFSRWKHVGIDSTRVPMQGKPAGAWCFGLDWGDINGDGLTDIAAGKWVYLNTGKPVPNWKRIEMPLELDALFVLKTGKKKAAGIFAVRCNEQY
jgi:hypothetical protein